jgi:hypothetical protein
MKLTLLALIALVPFCGATAAGVAVNPQAFLESIQGNYEIDLAGGHTPAKENNQAEVFADTEEGVLVLPFCGSNGLCDPGYVNLAYPTTTVEREDLGADHYRFELRAQFSAKTYRYTWEYEAGRITFTNYQYLQGNQTTQLTHVLHKVSH